MSEPGLFDVDPAAVVPVEDRYAGMGHDAKRTAKNLELIAAGMNPGTRMRLHRDAAENRDGEGLRCRDCAHLYSKTGDFQGSFLKCKKAAIRIDVQSTGPDMRSWWPACSLFEAKP
ncbi:hypothetical protein [Rhodococcus sp. 06-418-5]|uniref:hypothetical protein n=1 Tax=Rhodococcus sp. 06-418-5 TaxID=2022507 RepID=UPI00117BCDE7|nr:hypothetical protein [Rhodococcus sp. 06-418-5]